LGLTALLRLAAFQSARGEKPLPLFSTPTVGLSAGLNAHLC